MSWLDDFLDGVEHGFTKTASVFNNMVNTGAQTAENLATHGALLGLGTDLEMTRRHLDHALHKIRNKQSGASEILTASTNPHLRAYEENGNYLDAELKRNNALQAIAYSTKITKKGRRYVDNINTSQTGGNDFFGSYEPENAFVSLGKAITGKGVDAVYNDPGDGAHVQQDHYGNEVRLYNAPQPTGSNYKLKGGYTGGNLNLTDGGDYPLTGGSSLSQILGGMVYDLGNKPKKSVKKKRAKKA